MKEEGRKKQAMDKQQSKATQHTQGSHFSNKKKSRLGWDSSPQHYSLDRALYQLSCHVVRGSMCPYDNTMSYNYTHPSPAMQPGLGMGAAIAQQLTPSPVESSVREHLAPFPAAPTFKNHLTLSPAVGTV